MTLRTSAARHGTEVRTGIANRRASIPMSEPRDCREGEAEAVRWCVEHRQPMFGESMTCDAARPSDESEDYWIARALAAEHILDAAREGPGLDVELLVEAGFLDAYLNINGVKDEAEAMKLLRSDVRRYDRLAAAQQREGAGS